MKKIREIERNRRQRKRERKRPPLGEHTWGNEKEAPEASCTNSKRRVSPNEMPMVKSSLSTGGGRREIRRRGEEEEGETRTFSRCVSVTVMVKGLPVSAIAIEIQSSCIDLVRVKR